AKAVVKAAAAAPADAAPAPVVGVPAAAAPFLEAEAGAEAEEEGIAGRAGDAADEAEAGEEAAAEVADPDAAARVAAGGGGGDDGDGDDGDDDDGRGDGGDGEDEEGEDEAEAPITERYNLTFSAEELDNIAANLSTEAASGPVGERDAGLATGEFAPLAAHSVLDGVETEPSRDWSPASLKEVIVNAELQHSKLAADENYSGIYNALKDEGKAALALAPYVALAMFGAVNDSAEYVYSARPDSLAFFSSLPKAVLMTAVRDAAGLAFLRVHNYFTHGHCCVSEQAGMRRGARLYFTRWEEDPASVPSDAKVAQKDREYAGLLRRALHPICVRSGLELLAETIMEFSKAHIMAACHACRTNGWFGLQSDFIDVGFWKPDSFTSRRLKVAPEGGHQVTLFAAFAKDLLTAPTGGIILGQPGISKAGACSVHTTIKKVHDESVVEVSNEEWMSHLSLGSEDSEESQGDVSIALLLEKEYQRGMTTAAYRRWAYVARAAYLRLRRNGQGRAARQALRERLRMCGERAQVSAHNTLRDMLDEGDFVPDSEGVPAENAVLSELEWVDMVVQGWKTMAIEGEDAPPAGSGYAGPPERAPDGVTAAGSGVNAAEEEPASLLALSNSTGPSEQEIEESTFMEKGRLIRVENPEVDDGRDARFVQAVTEYTEELLTSLREYLDVAEASDGNLEDQSVSPEAEGERIEEWAVEVVDRLRFHWFQQLCPIALWNRRLEEELRDMGLEDCSCPPERYEEERREELRAARDEVDSDEATPGIRDGDAEAEVETMTESGAATFQVLIRGVDAWRFLLGLDSESFEENIDVVAAGRPLLPEHVAAMVTETVAKYGAHDRAVMTVAFVRFLRLLMSEVMQAFERGEGDGSSLMQRTLTGQFRVGTSPRQSWFHRVQMLQEELGRQSGGARNASIVGLQARLRQQHDLPEDQRESLEAMLVAMEEHGCQEGGVGDLAWQLLQWWDSLFNTRGCQVGPSGHPSRTGSASPRDEDLQEMARDEEDIRHERLREEEARSRQQAEREREEEEVLQYQMSLLEDGNDRGELSHPVADRVSSSKDPSTTRLSATEFRQWEDWEWHNLLREPPQKRQRRVMEITMSGSSGRDSPTVAKTLRIPLSDPGAMSLRMDLQVQVEHYPDDVETVILDRGLETGAVGQTQVVDGASLASETPGDALDSVQQKPRSEAHPVDDQDTIPLEAGDGDKDNALPGGAATLVDSPQQEDVQAEHVNEVGPLNDGGAEGLEVEHGMSQLEWSDYEGLYKKWREGALSDADIKQVGGSNLLDLMEAQFILDVDDSTQHLSTLPSGNEVKREGSRES
ncbi:unnamed protein product, partial [Symbiodinium sp. KB8]